MSVANITKITPRFVFGFPVAVEVTFRQRQGGSRTYLYDSLRAAIAILKGDDPAEWPGVLISETSAAEDKAGRISDIAEGIAGQGTAGDLAEAGAAEGIADVAEGVAEGAVGLAELL